MVAGLYIQDVWMGLIKPFFLGFTIVSIGCHVGSADDAAAPRVSVGRRRTPSSRARSR